MRMHLTYANVMATVAVFIALGGSSYAAITLSTNSVRSKHIKNGQVKRADLAASAVDSAKVKDGALLAQDFKPGALVAGAPGPRGLQGPKGDTGAPGAGSAVAYQGAAERGVELDGTTFGLKSCPDGQLLKSGGSGTYACAADNDANTQYQASAGRGLELNGTAFALSSCPSGQLLKSSGSGTYACASDVDTNTTYSAGGGLQQSGTQFSIAPGGVTGTQVADGSLTAADLGFVKQVSFPGGPLANGHCSGAVVYQTAQFAPGQEGDFTMLSSTPAVPLGFVVAGRVGPSNNGFREYYFNVCNLTGIQANVPATTVKMLVIAQ